MASSAPVTLQQKQLLATFSGSANCVAVGGSTVAATSGNSGACAVDLREVAQGEAAAVALFAGHGSAVHQVAVSWNGSAVATASLDGTVQVWNAANPSEVYARLSKEGHDRAVGVALSADGRFLAASFMRRSNKKGAIVVWRVTHTSDADAGAAGVVRVDSWAANLDVFMGALAISADGSVVAHAAKNRVYVVPVAAGGRAAKKWVVRGESSVAMDAAASRFAVADGDALRVWTRAPDREAELPGYNRSFRPFCAIAEDGKRVAAAIAGDRFRVWDAETAAIVADVAGFGAHTRGCAFHPDGNLLAMCCFDGTVYIADIDQGIAGAPGTLESGANAQGNGVLAEGVKSDDGVEIASGPAESGQTELLQSPPPETPGFGDEKENEVAEEEDAVEEENAVEEEDAAEEADETEVEDQEDEEDGIEEVAREETEAEPVVRGGFSWKAKKVFEMGLKMHERVEDGTLFHTQAGEQMEELFSEEEMERLEKYAIAYALLEADSESTWTVSKEQFIATALSISEKVNVAKSSPWVSAFEKGAGGAGGKLTLPQAAMIIGRTAEEAGEAPDKVKVLAGLEEAMESMRNDSGKKGMSLVCLEVFEKAVAVLGLDS